MRTHLHTPRIVVRIYISATAVLRSISALVMPTSTNVNSRLPGHSVFPIISVLSLFPLIKTTTVHPYSPAAK